MALDEYPELRKVFDRLMSEKQAIMEKTQPLHDEYEKLGQQMRPMEIKQRELAKQFHAIERPRLAEINQQLSALARGMGGLSLSSGAAQAAEPTPEAGKLN